MKKITLIPFIIITVLFAFAGMQSAESQIIKKLKKKAEKTVIKKLEDKTEKETNTAMDTILNNEKGNSGSTKNAGNDQVAVVSGNNEEEITIYSKSDWVAGEQLIFYEDFSNDSIGDFPLLWDTNASGEIIKLSNDPNKKWLKMFNYTMYQPDLPKELPKDFTIEFDAIAHGVSKEKTSQTARFIVMLGDGKGKLKEGNSYAHAYLPVFQGWVQGITFKSAKANVELASGRIEKDIRRAFMQGCHVGIAVKEKRFRLYVDGQKIMDFPRAMPEDEHIKTLLFSTYGMQNGLEHLLITNLQIAEGLPEPRAKLFTTGKYVTNAIHFDVASAEIKPQSYGILREIAEAVKTEKGKKIIIVGHTDADGSDAFNMELSKKRAASVKEALTSKFGVPAVQLTTNGKGESEPIASNDTVSGKAKNRRTEFIMQ